MNCLLNPTTDAELNKYHTDAQTSPLEDVYATAPMAAINSASIDLACPPGPHDQSLSVRSKKSVTQTLSFEEEVYSEFEQAISGRLEAVQQKLKTLSASSPRIAHQPAQSAKISTRLSAINWQYILFFGSFAFIFTLLGFDAMGLLVLFSR